MTFILLALKEWKVGLYNALVDVDNPDTNNKE